MLQNFNSKLKKDVLDICHCIKKNNGTAYLVGGCIRDAILGERIFDADIEVYGIDFVKLKKILSTIHKVDLVGKSYAVLKMQSLNIDLALPREENKLAPGHAAFEIKASPNLVFKKSGLRRDFTVNSILYDPLSNKMIDEFGGVADLKSKILRHISPKFCEDPLRPLRAMQFVARFGFTVDPATIEICKTINQDELPSERIFGEWKKMLLQGKYLDKALNFLYSINWLKYYPELAALPNCPQDKRWHPEGDVWIHTLACMNAFAYNRHLIEGENIEKEKLIVGFSVLTHDFGKAACTYFEQDKIKSTYHEVVGVKLANRFLLRLTNQSKLIESCLILVRNHMQPYALFAAKSTDNAVKRLANKVQRLDLLIHLCRADYLGCGRSLDAKTPHLDWLQERSKALDVVKQKLQPIIMGRHLQELDIAPGIQYKEILGKCFEAQTEGKFDNLENGKLFLKKLLR